MRVSETSVDNGRVMLQRQELCRRCSELSCGVSHCCRLSGIVRRSLTSAPLK